MKKLILFCLFVPLLLRAQQTNDVEELKMQVLALQTNLDHVQLNLKQADNKFKRGILISTIGYSLTITGGLMLGRKDDQLGQTLLVIGGTTGVVGTVLMIESFKYLGRAGKKKSAS